MKIIKWISKSKRLLLTAWAIAGVFLTYICAAEGAHQISEAMHEGSVDKTTVLSVMTCSFMVMVAAMTVIFMSYLMGEYDISKLKIGYLSAWTMVNSLHSVVPKDQYVTQVNKEMAQADYSTYLKPGDPVTVYILPWSGRRFYANEQILDFAFRSLRYRFSTGETITVNDLYSIIGLEPAENGDDYAWRLTEELGITDLDFYIDYTTDNALTGIIRYSSYPMLRGMDW